ncbi:MAG TPA: CdaR family protein [Vicinamibacterales bacterium]|nr:CdaR family protein [Vicinamibacterales bacterium]
MRYRFRPFRHFGLKVLAVVLAFLLWLVVAGEETVERSVRVPLELQQVPAGLDLVSEPPATVDVLVRGASDAVSRMSPGDLVAVLDLRTARSGRRFFPLTPEEVRAPFGVDVVEVVPNTVAIVFEKEGRKLVPIAPSVEGRPAPGYMIGQITSDPASVTVIGPDSVLDRLPAAMTEPVLVAGAKSRVQEAVTVGVADPHLRLQAPVTAKVTVNVIPAPAERTLLHVPVRIQHLGPGLEARALPPVVKVTVRGSETAVRALRADSIIVSVDASGLGAGRYTLTPRAAPQRDTGIVQIEPAEVQITIR